MAMGPAPYLGCGNVQLKIRSIIRRKRKQCWNQHGERRDLRLAFMKVPNG
ncbi:MAG: hypothetical protein K0Q43_1131 [Ramlibacter sp.]|jgi:hypothetical protein|nr:hypothetical protein [Ramlibacter sp.]